MRKFCVLVLTVLASPPAWSADCRLTENVLSGRESVTQTVTTSEGHQWLLVKKPGCGSIWVDKAAQMAWEFAPGVQYRFESAKDQCSHLSSWARGWKAGAGVVADLPSRAEFRTAHKHQIEEVFDELSDEYYRLYWTNHIYSSVTDAFFSTVVPGHSQKSASFARFRKNLMSFGTTNSDAFVDAICVASKRDRN